MATVTGVTTRQIKPLSNKGRFERLAYLFMRMSGVVLLFLAVGHVVIQLILNDVHNLTLRFVADQWDAWGWKAYDMLLLIFAVSHGLNGLRNILEDYIHNIGLMRIINIGLVVFMIATFLWAGIGISAFNPEDARAYQAWLESTR